MKKEEKGMKRKVLAILLAAVMTVMAGCKGTAPAETKTPEAQAGGEEASSAEAGGQQEKTTFKIAVVLHPLTKDEEFNNKEIYKLAEEATGVHIEWIPIAAYYARFGFAGCFSGTDKRGPDSKQYGLLCGFGRG